MKEIANIQKKQKKQDKCGSVLIFTLILMSIVLMTALGIMSTTIIQQNIASVTDDSTIAFQTADTGAEQAFHEFRRDRIATLNDFTSGSCSSGTVTVTNVDGVANVDYDIHFYKEDGSRMTSCSEDTMTIRSARITGYYLKAVRAIEIAVSIPTDDITSGLVAHWEFEGNMNDTVGSHDGSAHGGATTTGSAPVGTHMLTLDGSNDYVSVDADSDFDFSENDDYTISMWVRFDSTSGRQSILHKRLGYSLESDATEWSYQGLSPSTSSFAIDTDQWYHVVLWQSGITGSRGIYIDAELADDASSISASPNKNILLGVRDVGGELSRYFDGKIDDVRIYNRALDLIEIVILCENEFDGNSGHPEGSDVCGQ